MALSECHEIATATKQAVTCSDPIQNEFAQCQRGQGTAALHNGYLKSEQVISKI